MYVTLRFAQLRLPGVAISLASSVNKFLSVTRRPISEKVAHERAKISLSFISLPLFPSFRFFPATRYLFRPFIARFVLSETASAETEFPFFRAFFYLRDRPRSRKARLVENALYPRDEKFSNRREPLVPSEFQSDAAASARSPRSELARFSANIADNGREWNVVDENRASR